LGVFESRLLRRIFVPKRKWWEIIHIKRSFITCTLHKILMGKMK
jgi:hypothetical protein